MTKRADLGIEGLHFSILSKIKNEVDNVVHPLVNDTDRRTYGLADIENMSYRD